MRIIFIFLSVLGSLSCFAFDDSRARVMDGPVCVNNWHTIMFTALFTLLIWLSILFFKTPFFRLISCIVSGVILIILQFLI